MTVSTESYRCTACGKSCSADDVYDSSGRVVCKSCFVIQPVRNVSHQDGKSHSVVARPAEGKADSKKLSRGNLRTRVTCPHCWNLFPPENVLWVTQHQDLRGDPVLGEAQVRFLPTRFTVDGQAIDARGMACQALACPRCHLIVPRAAIENEPLFVSIIGVPASGKSYFLTAMTWELRRLMPGQFGLTFTDADAVTNQLLTNNEEILFLQHDAEKPVAIEKTETEGSLYDQVRLGQQILNLPKPFLFTLRPNSEHPNVAKSDQIGRVMCLYDNAGEHFRPGMDSTASPTTQHLAKSRVLMFLYDPTKDPRFRERCKGISCDPQIGAGALVERQETVLTEAASRVRKYAGLAPTKKHDRPLVVIVPKFDIWGHLLDCNLEVEPFVQKSLQCRLSAVDTKTIEVVSAKLRKLLLEITPEFVAAAEEFCQHVVYIPISVFTSPPVQAEGRREMLIRPKDVKPRWVTAPVLYMFAKWTTGLIASAK